MAEIWQNDIFAGFSISNKVSIKYVEAVILNEWVTLWSVLSSWGNEAVLVRCWPDTLSLWGLRLMSQSRLAFGWLLGVSGFHTFPVDLPLHLRFTCTSGDSTQLAFAFGSGSADLLWQRLSLNWGVRSVHICSDYWYKFGLDSPILIYYLNFFFVVGVLFLFNCS